MMSVKKLFTILCVLGLPSAFVFAQTDSFSGDASCSISSEKTCSTGSMLVMSEGMSGMKCPMMGKMQGGMSGGMMSGGMPGMQCPMMGKMQGGMSGGMMSGEMMKNMMSGGMMKNMMSGGMMSGMKCPMMGKMEGMMMGDDMMSKMQAGEESKKHEGHHPENAMGTTMRKKEHIIHRIDQLMQQAMEKNDMERHNKLEGRKKKISLLSLSFKGAFCSPFSLFQIPIPLVQENLLLFYSLPFFSCKQ